MSAPEGATCLWCHASIPSGGTGRRKRYCCRSCRQRAYESRKFGIERVWETLRSMFADCYLCGEPLDWADPQSVCTDHQIATVWGGRTNVENLRPVHVRCNARKGAALLVSIEDLRAPV